MRHIDLGTVTPHRSMAVFHAIANAAGVDDEITLVTVRPDKAFVSVGYHQLASREVRVNYCRELGIPISRRMTGGGTVLLDSDQIFWHLILPGAHVAIRDLYQALMPAPVNTYRKMGIEAEMRPLNDIVARAKKIGGTGAATIGSSLVFVGSLMFDFDRSLMAQVLNVPSEKFRDKTIQSLKDYMTTIKDELGDRSPSKEVAVSMLAEEFAELLGSSVHPGCMTEAEESECARYESFLFEPSFVFQHEGWFEPRLTIHYGVYLYEGLHKTPDGLVRVIWLEKDHRFERVWLGGDFTVDPPDTLRILENRLQGKPTHPDSLSTVCETIFAGIAVSGLGPRDLAQALARPERLSQSP